VPAAAAGAAPTAVAGIAIDRDAHTVTTAGRRIELTAAEFRLLDLLASHPGQVLTRERILDGLWGDEKSVTDRSVDVHMRHLREKLGAGGNRIVNVRGVGYVTMNAPVPSTSGDPRDHRPHVAVSSYPGAGSRRGTTGRGRAGRRPRWPGRPFRWDLPCGSVERGRHTAPA
jgi:DNA-binding winged helix-turn-helix (wHTH) protein